MALGAPATEIQRMVLSESLRISAWGVRSWFLGVGLLHPVAYLFSAAAGIALTLIAAWLPALRARHVDPMTALRTE